MEGKGPQAERDAICNHAFEAADFFLSFPPLKSLQRHEKWKRERERGDK